MATNIHILENNYTNKCMENYIFSNNILSSEKFPFKK